MSPSNCPWCGAGPMTVGRGLAKPLPKGRIRWLCGSMKNGRRPWQDVHCQLNVAEAEVDHLTAALLEAAEMTEVEADRTLIYNHCCQAVEAVQPAKV